MAQGPSSINNLLHGALARHGIDKRVFATQIVKQANLTLDSLLKPDQRPDLQVVSYQNLELLIACRSAPARYVMEGLKAKLAAELEVKFPDHTFSKINCQLRPGTVSEEEWYTGGQL